VGVSIRLSWVIDLIFTLLGGATMLMPAEMAQYIGGIMVFLGILGGLWILVAYLYLRRLPGLLVKRVHTSFIEAKFDAIGMSSPYIDFYFNIHNYLSTSLIPTGQRRGELWNPRIEAWRSSWDANVHANVHVIKPDTNTLLRVRWVVPQGHHSPMSEFAFRAIDNPPEQCLTFEDMGIELKAKFLGLERRIGWLQLPGVTDVPIPDHITFETVRKEYNRQES
jgi:hypothetical protein